MSGLDLSELLAAAEAAPPVAVVDAVGEVLAEMLGAQHESFLIADYSGESLIRLGHVAGRRFGAQRASHETAERVSLQATPQGEALSSQTVQVVEGDDGTWLFAPVTSRGEAVGILELSLSEAPTSAIVTDVARAAHALAYIIIANRRYTDLFDWGQRTVPLSLAAEIQHRLLPGSYTCEGGQFTLAAWLEPAGDVGGDTFDFSLDRDALYFSMTDAMGHTVMASLLATLLVGAVRNGRRAGAGIVEQAELADAALIEHARGSQFVTGQIVRVDLEGQTAEIVNAGHPPPLRLRNGVVQEVGLEADPPFGAVDETSFRLQTLELQPGDRLMFLTDGVLERRAAAVDVRANMVASGGEHPREAVQQLIRAAVKASGGTLEDDATALCFDWHGGPRRDRTSDSGADTTA